MQYGCIIKMGAYSHGVLIFYGCLLTQFYCSNIPQMEQREPEGQMVFHLGNVTYLLDVTPRNPLPYLHNGMGGSDNILSLPPIPFCVNKIQNLIAKQQCFSR